MIGIARPPGCTIQTRKPGGHEKGPARARPVTGPHAGPGCSVHSGCDRQADGGRRGGSVTLRVRILRPPLPPPSSSRPLPASVLTRRSRRVRPRPACRTARTENTRPATGARPLGAPARTLDSCHAELCSSRADQRAVAVSRGAFRQGVPGAAARASARRCRSPALVQLAGPRRFTPIPRSCARRTPWSCSRRAAHPRRRCRPP